MSFRPALLALLVMAAGPVPLPGVGGGADPRVAVDGAAAPWSALLRLQIPGVSVCTAVLLAPRLALTAAHCIYGRRLGHFAPAGSVHLLSGYRAGGFAAHVVASSVRIAAGYDPARPDATRAWDAALLVLAAPLAATPLPLAEGLPAPGAAAMLGGYNQDRVETIFADRDCHVVASEAGGVLHDCTATRGTSGAPLLLRAADGGWRIGGIETGAWMGRAGGLAVAVPVLRALLAAD